MVQEPASMGKCSVSSSASAGLLVMTFRFVKMRLLFFNWSSNTIILDNILRTFGNMTFQIYFPLLLYKSIYNYNY